MSVMSWCHAKNRSTLVCFALTVGFVFEDFQCAVCRNSTQSIQFCVVPLIIRCFCRKINVTFKVWLPTISLSLSYILYTYIISLKLLFSKKQAKLVKEYCRKIFYLCKISGIDWGCTIVEGIDIVISFISAIYTAIWKNEESSPNMQCVFHLQIH